MTDSLLPPGIVTAIGEADPLMDLDDQAFWDWAVDVVAEEVMAEFAAKRSASDVHTSAAPEVPSPAASGSGAPTGSPIHPARPVEP